MITAIPHTGIVVRDLEGALRFYRDLLGFSVATELREAGDYINNMLGLERVDVTTVKLSAPDHSLIELLQFRSHRGRSRGPMAPCDFGITHIAFTVDDLDREYKRLRAAGVAFNARSQTSPDGYAKVTFCRDPEGNLIELVEVLRR